MVPGDTNLPARADDKQQFSFNNGTSICVNCQANETTGYKGGGELAFIWKTPEENDDGDLEYRMAKLPIEGTSLADINCGPIISTADTSNIVPVTHHALLSLDDNTKMLFGFPPLAFASHAPRSPISIGIRYIDTKTNFEVRYGDVIEHTASGDLWLVIAFYPKAMGIMVSQEFELRIIILFLKK